MTDQLRVLLEIGPKGKRIVAAAMDWPGLERWGRTEHDAVDRLRAYVPRYVPVAERVGLRSELERGVMPHIVERTPGNTSTDWWGVAHVPSVIEAEPLADDELERRIGIMRATWAFFDDASEATDAPLTKGPRGGGRERDQIVRHVYASERHNLWRKVGIREDDEARLTPKSSPRFASATLQRSASTTPRAARPAAGRCASSSAARRSTRWTTPGSWRTATPVETS